MAPLPLPVAVWRRPLQALLLLACVSCASGLGRQSRGTSPSLSALEAAQELAEGHETSAATQDTTAIGKVVQMLSEMLERSEANKKEADELQAQVAADCTKTQTETSDALKALETKIQKLDADIVQKNVEVKNLQDTITEQELLMVKESQALEILESDHKAEMANATQIVAALDRSIVALDRASEVLSAKVSLAQAAPGALRSAAPAPPEARMALAEAARSVNMARRYTPDSQSSAGTINKDEHLFDEFNSLSTASTAFESQSGGVVEILGKLKNFMSELKDKKSVMMHGLKEEHKEAAAGKNTAITNARDAQSAAQGSMASTQALLQTATEDLAQAKENEQATTEYMVTLTQSCDERAESHTEMSTLRENEITALAKAVEVIEGIGKPSSALLRVHMSTASAGRRHVPMGPSQTQSLIITSQKVLGFLRTEAAKIQSSSLDALVSSVADLVVAPGDDSIEVVASSDPMVKVRAMIQDLIGRLQAEAAQESSHKAWCDEQLAENDHATKTAKGDIERHTAKMQSIKGEIGKLNLEVADLKATEAKMVPEREEQATEREKEKAQNEKVIQEAQEATQAVDAAIMVLTDYYKEAGKKVSLSQVGDNRREEPVAEAETPTTTMPPSLSKAEAEGPLSTEGQGVLAMLEVIKDGYTELIKKTEADETAAAAKSVELLREHDVVFAETEKDIEYKIKETDSDTAALKVSSNDLETSVKLMDDAAKTREELGPPCLNVETYEEKAAKREEEITALKESYSMIEAYEAEMGGFALLQGRGAEAHRRSVSRQASALFKLNGTAAAAVNGTAAAAVAAAANGTANGARAATKRAALDDVIRLLEGMRSEVQADLTADTDVQFKMLGWCQQTIEEKQQAIADADDRDRQLVTLVATSAAAKAQHETELEQLTAELAKAHKSEGEAASLHSNEIEKFREQEKQILSSINALKNALVVLDKHYTQPAKGATLVNVANDVKKALKLLPAGEGVLNVVETSATFQDFLISPDTVLPPLAPRLHRATLASTGVKITDSQDGGQIYGILKQLLETFEADLAEMQKQTGTDSQTYVDLKTTKEAQIEALEASTTNKQAQQATAQSTNAQAKEDLEYLRAAREADAKLLYSVQAQCQESSHEFKVRNETRVKEIASLDQALVILKAEETTSDSSAAPVALHAMSPNATHHVFVRHHRVKTTVTTPAPKVSAQSILDSFIKGHQAWAPSHPRHPSVALAHAKVALPSASVLPGKLPPSAAAPAKDARRVVQKAIDLLAKRGALRRVQQDPSLDVGAMKKDLSSGLGGLVAMIEEIKRDMLKEKVMEAQMRDTCIDEKHEGEAQMDRRVSDKTRYDSTILRKSEEIEAGQKQMLALQQDISALNEALQAAIAARNTQYGEFRTTVQEQEAHQAKLHEAIQALQKFYEESKAPAAAKLFVQLGAAPAVASAAPVPSAPAAPVPLAKAVHASGAAAPSAAAGAAAGAAKATDGAKSALKLVAQEPVTTARSRYEGSSGNKPGAASVARPDDTKHSKPLSKHGGGGGVISLLHLLIEESEALVEQIVTAETGARDAHSLDLEDTRRSIDAKDREMIVLNDNIGNLVLDKENTENLMHAVMKEMDEITSFLLMLSDKCDFLVAHFEDNQAARDQELRNLDDARAALLSADLASLTQVSARLKAA